MVRCCTEVQSVSPEAAVSFMHQAKHARQKVRSVMSKKVCSPQKTFAAHAGEQGTKRRRDPSDRLKWQVRG
jgi:hypothetical protein